MPTPAVRPIGSLAPLLVILLSCGHGGGTALFTRLGPGHTGISFANTITITDSVNELTNPYVYNGGGVAIGDIDNDGLPDIFFAGNMVSSRLYRNKGDMRFEDITTSARVTTHGWASGVSLVDINNDGYLDIYVSMSGPPWSTPQDRKNLLFINEGNGTFTESAAQYHLDDPGFTTHAVFFDCDGDGDLDVFLLGNSPKDFERSQAEIHPAGIRKYDPAGSEKLYRNNGDGTFTDVSERAGILPDAQFGLGVVVSDFNRDGWPDLYVSNDVVAEDVLYINHRDGTFTNKSREWLKHTSFAGMGIDAADFNNDGWPDIMQVDMMPEDLAARKRTSSAATDVADEDRRRHRFQGGYTQNTLQLSSGANLAGTLAFSEIARLAGVAYTDWSWSALFGDVDNDGYKDLMITNGYPKAVTDYDYQTTMFRLRRNEGARTSPQELSLLQALPAIRVPNYLFRNNGDLTFTNRAHEWGVDDPGFSYGAVLADLNNDGRLDLVINNIDGPASIYEQLHPPADSSHYLDILLRGHAPNRGAVGATLTLIAGGHRQYIYHTPEHGYLSSVADREHFGLGTATVVDTLTVTWPDGRIQVLTNLAADRLLTLTQDGVGSPAAPATRPQGRLFQAVDRRFVPSYKHQESGSEDFSLQPLLPYQLSQHGPVLAVADVNGDGREDLFVGGSTDTAGTLFLQQPDGRFARAAEQPWAGTTDPGHDVAGALFFDANGDGKPDLYLASAGYRRTPVSRQLQDRLYINRGGARFVRDTAALPSMITATAAVAAGDFTGDGKPDLFVGGRVLPRSYPSPTRSYLLRNDGDHFTDVSEAWAPQLVTPGGMITAAVWMDFDGDGRLDLVTAGEWMPLQFFHNEGTRFRDVTASMTPGNTRGWWWSLAAADINRDGRPDLIAGNFGSNHTFTTSPQSRLGVYAGDFTGNGQTGILLTRDSGRGAVPLFGLATIGPSIYTIGIRFPTFAAFSQADINAVLGDSTTARVLHYEVDTFASLYLQNTGNGTFTAAELPRMAQLSPVRGIVVTDVDGDGSLDLVVAGNLYDTAPNTAPADAGNGLWLKGDGRGHFMPVATGESGFLAPYDVTGLVTIQTPAGLAVLVANSGDSLQAFLIRRP
jgi:hypothetical protein